MSFQKSPKVASIDLPSALVTRKESMVDWFDEGINDGLVQIDRSVVNPIQDLCEADGYAEMKSQMASCQCLPKYQTF